MTRARGFVAVLLVTACAPAGLTNIPSAAAPEPIRYMSGDLRHVATFSENSARLGAPLDLEFVWREEPSRRFETKDGAQCISVGSPGNTVEFAVKRPIMAGEGYRCLETSFQVVRCFADCRAAVIEIARPLSGNLPGTRSAYMYVDSCIGVVALSEVHNMTANIPFEAEWLRGPVGILADADAPTCD